MSSLPQLIRGHIFLALKIQLKNPNFRSPIHHLHSKTLVSNSDVAPIVDYEAGEPANLAEGRNALKGERDAGPFDRKVLKKSSADQIRHPWPEWVELMRNLLRYGYFEGAENPFRDGGLKAKSLNRIRTACATFASDRPDLIRHFSRKDIEVLAGSRCPSIDRKVVNSGKRLRAHVGIDEGNVCNSCILRGKCERAYVKATGDEGVHTLDIVRLLLAYGLDHISDVVENKQSLNRIVEDSVRKLLREIVEYSLKEVDPDQLNLSMQEDLARLTQAHKNAPKKKNNLVYQTRLVDDRRRKLGKDLDHLPLKKGDWLCSRCNFLNFAKNTRCLECNEMPPKRQLGPGEWECDSCSYINFRRNLVCLRCNHRRLKATSSGFTFHGIQQDNGLHHQHYQLQHSD